MRGAVEDTAVSVNVTAGTPGADALIVTVPALGPSVTLTDAVPLGRVKAAAYAKVAAPGGLT